MGQDLAIGLAERSSTGSTSLRFRGVKGTTGTQASFLALFERASDGEQAAAKVEQLDLKVTRRWAGTPSAD